MPWALMDGCSTPTLSHRPRWWTLWGPETPSTRPSSSACPRVSTPAAGPGPGPAPAQKARLIWLLVPPSREEHAGGTELWLPGGGQEVWPAGLRWHRVSALWQEAPAHIPAPGQHHWLLSPSLLWPAGIRLPCPPGGCRLWEGSTCDLASHMAELQSK